MNDSSWPDWQVTKLDAARRQLETAIRLLFAQNDAVSIHTLAHASFGILKDVANNRNVRRALGVADELAASESKGYWLRLNKTGSFFKHAHKDPDGVLHSISEEENESLISIAVEIYRDLGCLETAEIDAFYLWWCCIHFKAIDNVKEPFMSWLTQNTLRFHSDDRRELLKLGAELLAFLKESESA